LASIRIKIEVTKNDRRWQTLPAINPRIVLAALVVSILLHLASWFGAAFAPSPTMPGMKDSVKIRSITADEKHLLDKLQRDVAKAKRIIETKQTETVRPKLPSSLGAQDHTTERETRLPDRSILDSKGLDPSTRPGRVQNEQSSQKSKPVPAAKISPTPKIATMPGQLLTRQRREKNLKPYEKLLPRENSDIFAPKSGGFVEHLDKSIAEGDRVDMNTSNFRYLSYFTGLRKQIEMVWIYPSDAVRRGLQGAVQLEMVIEKDGRVSRVRVIESSGYTTLDENMLKTIKLASPFAPLPKNWGKERLVVTGSFHYILSYASH